MTVTYTLTLTLTLTLTKGDASTRLGVRVRNAHDTPGVVEVYEITPDGVAARSGTPSYTPSTDPSPKPEALALYL